MRYTTLPTAPALTLRSVLRRALRQTEGLIGSISALLGLDLPVPDHTILSRLAESLDVARPRPLAQAPVPCLLADSKELKLCRSGEWLLEKHGTNTRRSWRKLHIAVDADTGRIVAAAVTTSDGDNTSQVGALLDQVDGPVASFTLDGGTIRAASTARLYRVIPRRLSSFRRAPAPCRAKQCRRHPRCETAICRSSPSRGRMPWSETNHHFPA